MCDGLGKLRGHRPQEIGVGCSLPARQSTLVRATNFGWFFVVRPALSMNRDGSKSRAKATAAARFARRLPTNFFGEELAHVGKQVFFECLYVAERIGSPGRTRTCNISDNSRSG
jgi:hypothetical protein